MGADPRFARRLAENLRRVRAESGLSQEEVGFRAGLHRTEVGLLERGGRVPRVDTLVKLAGALGVTLRSPLLDGIAWRPRVDQPGGGDFSLGEGPGSTSPGGSLSDRAEG